MVQPYRFVLIPLLALACPAFLGQRSTAADPPPKKSEEAPAKEADAVLKLPADPAQKKRLDAARDYIKEEAWNETVWLLQKLLDVAQDSFVEGVGKDAKGKEVVAWVSVRSEAERLLGSLPPKGMAVYDEQFGPIAAAMLKEAKEKKDADLLAQVAQRYLYTAVGPEAAQRLGSHHLEAGNFAVASITFGRLVERQPLNKWTPEALYDATRAFRRAGDRPNADKTWKELTKRAGKEGLRIGDKTQSVEQWQAELDKVAPPKPGHKES
jgi:TolA-binding protein